MYHNNIPKVRARVCSERKLGPQMSRALPHSSTSYPRSPLLIKITEESTSFQTTRLRARSRAYIPFQQFPLQHIPRQQDMQASGLAGRKSLTRPIAFLGSYTLPSSIRSCSLYHQYSVHTYCRTLRTDLIMLPLK